MLSAADQLREEHEGLFFAAAGDVTTLLQAADAVCECGVRIYGVILTTNAPLADRMRRLTEKLGKVRGFAVSGNGPFLVEIGLHDSDGMPAGKARAVLWQPPGSDTVHYLTCQPREKFIHLFEMVHSFLQPDVCRLFLKTPHIEETLRTIARQNPGIELKVKEYVARKLIKSRGRYGEVDTKVQYTNEDFATVFRELQSEGQWLSSIKVQAEGPRTFTGRITRHSSFSCSAGFQEFYAAAVCSIEQVVHRFKKLFQDRDRTKAVQKPILPLKIVYNRSIFADRKQNHRLIAVLEALPNAALSVFHPNPYLHASIIDYADGSTYTILVSTANGILISPERKATPQSLSRLCDHICDHFEEGEVLEYQPNERR